jgi:hypothetical protein
MQSGRQPKIFLGVSFPHCGASEKKEMGEGVVVARDRIEPPTRGKGNHL